MRTISNTEFAAHPEMYLDIAQEQDLRIRRGNDVFHLTREEEFPPQQALAPDDDLRNAITMEELLVGVHEDIRRKWAERRR